MLDIFLIDINKDVKNDRKDDFLQILDKKEIIKYNNILSAKDREKFLFSRYVLKKILSRYTDQEMIKIRFEYNSFGKPLIPNSFLNFNLSHSDNFLVVGISDKEIGIDIENIKLIDLGMAKIFCTNKELQQINNSADKYYIFFQLWTLKESFIKNIGKGLSFNIKDLDFNLDNLSAIQLRINNRLFKTLNFFTENINNDILSVCYRKIQEKPNIIYFDNIN